MRALTERPLKQGLFLRAGLVGSVAYVSCGTVTYFRSWLASQIADVVTVLCANLPVRDNTGVAAAVDCLQCNSKTHTERLHCIEDESQGKRTTWSGVRIE